MRATVLGGGSWGTALATQLARVGHDTVMWDRNPERCEHINAHHQNPRYLKGVDLPESLKASADLEGAVSRAELLVPVVPSHALRGVLERAAPHLSVDALVGCATKGIEDGSLKTMHEVLTEIVPGAEERVSMLYGPSFALEVAKGLPTAVVVAGPDATAHASAEAFHGPQFRCYHTEDTIGVCLGGSLKNVMAIACGVSDGVGLGSNARAGIITRGLAEVTRLAVAEGAHFTRDLVNDPANILTTVEFAARLEGLRDLGLEVEVLDEPALEALGMRALLGVGLQAPVFVEAHAKAAREDAPIETKSARPRADEIELHMVRSREARARLRVHLGERQGLDGVV